MDRLPVLLVHGFGSSYEDGWERHGWPDLLDDLGFRAVPVGLDGHGPGDHSHDPAQYQDPERPILDSAHRIGTSVHGIGFSAGALSLLRAASSAPHLFNRLVVIGLGDAVLPEGGAEAERLADIVGTEEPAPMAPHDAVFWRMANSHGNDPQALAAFLRGATAPLDPAQLTRIRSKILVIWGEGDHAGEPRELTHALDATARVVPHADHFSLPANMRTINWSLDWLSSSTTRR